jgi:hypothetical protein
MARGKNLQDTVERFGARDTLSGRDEKKVCVADGRAENHGDFSWARLKTEPAPGQAVVAPSVDEWGWFCARVEFPSRTIPPRGAQAEGVRNGAMARTIITSR